MSIDQSVGSSSDGYWSTAVSEVTPNKITIRGYPLDELVGRVSFVDALVLCLRGELPSELESRCVNAILTSALDHQFINSTVLAARTVVSGNPDPVAGLAAGILTFGPVTGGAPANVMELLSEIASVDPGQASREGAVDAVVSSRLKAGRKVPGIGHPIHPLVDEHYTWRSRALRTRLNEFGLGSRAFEVVEQVRAATASRLSKPLPINVDGVMGAAFFELGYTSLQVRALAPFTLLPGIAAHVVEEILDGEPLRVVSNGVYNGVATRHLPVAAHAVDHE